jgi:lysine-N-methylase
MRQDWPNNVSRSALETSALTGEMDAPMAGPLPGLPSIPPLPAPARRVPTRPTPQPEREYTRPRYAQKFHCIASACEDTCCQGWGVPIDRATFEKYEAVETLKPHIGTLIVLNTKQPTQAHFATIPLTANATCSFLDGDRLCGIQKQLGPSMLSATCATYPRAMSTIAGEQEEALNLSCPEAARVALLDPNLLDQDLSIAGVERYAAVRQLADAPLQAPEALLAVREFTLMLLRDRTYPIWQRLYLLGILGRRLNALSLQARSGSESLAAWCSTNPSAVGRLLDDSARSAVLGTLRTTMDTVESRPDQQLKMVMELLRIRLAQPPVPARLVECIQQFEAGIGSKKAQNEAEILAEYATGLRHHRALMKQSPHVMENLLINFVFKNNYPFGRVKAADAAVPPIEGQDPPDAESEHLSLCIHAALVQTMLIGLAAHYREAYDLCHVVKLVQSLARTFEHSHESAEQIKKWGRSKGLNHPRNMAILLHQDA